ncbi:glycosyltransferase [Alphaproteobacteria bacterium]|nr:glycosyltransferase [Alphaproteobacteria bacterium]
MLSKVAILLLRKHVVLVPSQHVSDELLSVLPKIEVLENFTEVHEYQLAKAKLFNSIHSNEGAIKIAWNSNIIYSKGFFNAASYIENLYAQGIDVEFHVFGIPMACDYMNLVDCEKQFRSFLNVPWFIYRGQLSRSEVIEAVADCSIVTLPSFYASECQPLALIDAMVLGKYLLVSDTPAITATCSGYSGTYNLVEEDGSDSDRFLNNAKKFLLISEKSAQHAQDRFSKQRFNERIIGYLYD